MTDSGYKPQKNLKKHEKFRVFIERLFCFGGFFHEKAVFEPPAAAGRFPAAERPFHPLSFYIKSKVDNLCPP